MQYSNMTRLTCFKEQLIILFPTFKSCFAKATNRNILEIYSRRATNISCSSDYRNVLSNILSSSLTRRSKVYNLRQKLS